VIHELSALSSRAGSERTTLHQAGQGGGIGRDSHRWANGLWAMAGCVENAELYLEGVATVDAVLDVNCRAQRCRSWRR